MKKTILITGSTDGIGKLAAFNFAKEGHLVLLHGRNRQKLDQVVAEINKNIDHSNIHGFVADFSDLNSISKMVEEINQVVSKLDILINNAGIFKSNSEKNKQGLDIRFVVNYLTPYHLTRQLLPLFDKTNASRIINLSSAAQSTVSLNALNGKENLSSQEAYAQSKLALTMWSMDLAKKHHPISTIAVNPGSLLNTKMVQEAYGQHWSAADKGSDILFSLALSDKYLGITGKYFDNDKGSFSKAHLDAYDEEKIRALIQETEEIIRVCP